MQVTVNYWGLLLAAIASMIVGFLWYSPLLFGKVWMRLKGFSLDSLQSEQQRMGLYYGLSFLLTLVMGFVLSHIITFSNNFYGYPMIQTGLITAFWVWLGFVMPVQATATIFGEKKWALFAIDTGYQFVSLLIMGLLLGSFN